MSFFLDIDKFCNKADADMKAAVQKIMQWTPQEHFLYSALGEYEARFVTEVDHEELNIGL